jgi:hypothetical protein
MGLRPRPFRQSRPDVERSLQVLNVKSLPARAAGRNLPRFSAPGELAVRLACEDLKSIVAAPCRPGMARSAAPVSGTEPVPPGRSSHGVRWSSSRTVCLRSSSTLYRPRAKAFLGSFFGKKNDVIFRRAVGWERKINFVGLSPGRLNKDVGVSLGKRVTTVEGLVARRAFSLSEFSAKKEASV